MSVIRVPGSRGAAIVGVLILGALASAPASADWTGKGEGGLVLSRGNSDATSANAKLDIAEDKDGWKNSLFLAGLYGKNSSFTTAERVEGRYELDRKITDRLYWFVGFNAIRDLFSGFDYQATANGGIGYKVIDSASTKLATTVGVGYRRLRPETLVKDAAGQVIERDKLDATGSAVGTFGLDFSHQLTQTTKLLDKLLVEAGSSNTSVSNDFGVQVSMTDRLALSFGYGVRFNSDPPPGSKRTDQTTTINIVYNIK